jgi:hypothetical protein
MDPRCTWEGENAVEHGRSGLHPTQEFAPASQSEPDNGPDPFEMLAKYGSLRGPNGRPEPVPANKRGGWRTREEAAPLVAAEYARRRAKLAPKDVR